MRNFLTAIVNTIITLFKIAIILVVFVAVLLAYYSLMNFALKDLLTPTSISVLSNFILFATVIVYVLFKVVNFSSLLESKKAEVVKVIENSSVEKEKSIEDLSKIQKSMANLESEIQSILDNSSKNASLVGEKLMQQAEKSAKQIKENTNKAYENSCSNLKNDISLRALNASIEVAKNHIVNELKINPDLHNKLIDESLEALDEVTL